MSAGKDFELELRKSFVAQLPYCWTTRFTDSVTLRYDPKGELLDLRTKKRLTKVHAKTPPDLLVVAPEWAALIECKAQLIDMGRVEPLETPIPLKNLAAHQLEHLVAFDALSDHHYGMVAVQFYNGRLGGARIHRAWLVPVAYWAVFQDVHDRASVPMSQLMMDLPNHEVAWVPSQNGWQVVGASEGWRTLPSFTTSHEQGQLL